MSILEELTRCEEAVWQALVSGDRDADTKALDDNFLGVYPSGFAKKSDHVDQLTDGPTIKTYTLSERQVLRLGNDHAVLSYRATFTRLTSTVSEEMFVSSIWKRRDQGWVNVFSQDTPAAD